MSNAVNLGFAWRSPLLPPSVLMLPGNPHQQNAHFALRRTLNNSKDSFCFALSLFFLSLSLFLFSPLIVRFFHLFRSLESFSYSLPRDFLRNLTFFSLSKMRFSVFFVFVYFLSVRWLLELLLESSSPSESLSQRKIEILQDDEDDDEITFFVVFWLFTQTLSSLFLFLPLKNFF